MASVILSTFANVDITLQWPPSFSEFTAAIVQSHSTSVVANHQGSAADQRFIRLTGNLLDEGTVPAAAVISDVTLSTVYSMTTTDYGLLSLQTPAGTASVGNFIAGGGATGSGTISASLGAMSRAALFTLFTTNIYVWQVLVQNGNLGSVLPWTATVNITSYTVTVTYSVTPGSNLTGSPPFQTLGQWALHKLDIQPRREGPAK